MRSGPLRDRVTIKTPTFAKDANGAPTVTYATVETVWGRLEELSNRERLIAAQVQSRMVGRVRLRYYSGLTTRHQLVIGSRTFGIVGVTNPDGLRVEHVCDVVEVT